MSIPEPDLRSCLALLEPHASHPGTPAIHDPIYAMVTGDCGAVLPELIAALERHSTHPAAPKIREILAAHVTIEVPGLLSVLTRYGPVADSDDLPGEVARRLERYEEERRITRGRIESLECALDASGRSANAVAALGAFALLFALVGWAVALGWMEVNWMDSPIPDGSIESQGSR